MVEIAPLRDVVFSMLFLVRLVPALAEMELTEAFLLPSSSVFFSIIVETVSDIMPLTLLSKSSLLERLFLTNFFFLFA